MVDNGSLSRAAQCLHVAQSALSKHLAELEDEFGTRLVDRGRNGVAPTEAGRILYDYAQGIAKQLTDARAAVHCAAYHVVGSVIVALPHTVAVSIALPLIQAAARCFPHVTLQLNEELTGNMSDLLMRGRVDLAVFTDTLAREDVEFLPLMQEDFVLLDSPLDADAFPPGAVGLARAASRPLVLSSSVHGHCTRWIVDEVLRRVGLPELKTMLVINSGPILKSAIEAGIGPTIMPSGFAQKEVEAGRLQAHRIQSDEMFRTLGVARYRHLPITNAKRAVERLISDVMRELCTSGQWSGARYIGPDAPR